MIRGLLFSSGIIKACIRGAKVELGVGEVTGNITNSGEPLNTEVKANGPLRGVCTQVREWTKQPPCWISNWALERGS